MATKTARKFRLITRSDFDGLVSAILLREQKQIRDIHFVHPKDMQDGKIKISDRDITTNLPYVEGVRLAFDHHPSEARRVGKRENFIMNPRAPSASRVVYEHFGGESVFPEYTREMMAAVDKADSGRFTRNEIFRPKGWVLLNFLLDPRTGLGRFRNFRITNEALMMSLIDYCRHHPIKKVLKLYDLIERSGRYFVMSEMFMDQIVRCASVHGKTVVVDLRRENLILAGNRFMVYSLYSECNMSVHLLRGIHRGRTEIAVGRSIFNRTSRCNVGRLMLKYGGGGHAAVGACQVPDAEAGGILEDLVRQISSAG